MSCESELTPKVSNEEAILLVKNAFGITIKPESIKEFPSYNDQNIYMENANNDEAYVFKLHDISRNSQNIVHLEAQNKLMTLLSDNGIVCPNPSIKTQEWIEIEKQYNNADADESKLPIEFNEQVITNAHKGTEYSNFTTSVPNHPLRVGRLLHFVSGSLVVSEKHNPVLIRDLGQYLARFNIIATKFDTSPYPTLNRSDGGEWHMDNCDTTINTYVSKLPTQEKIECIQNITNYYINNIKPIVLGVDQETGKRTFPIQIIHGDANDYNLIVNYETNKVSAVIDFGDITYSARIHEIAISGAYMMLDVSPENYNVDSTSPVSAELLVMKEMLLGYKSMIPLTRVEAETVFILGLMRICTSVVMSNITYARNPENEYLLVTSAPGWRLLFGILEKYGTIENAQKTFVEEIINPMYENLE